MEKNCFLLFFFCEDMQLIFFGKDMEKLDDLKKTVICLPNNLSCSIPLPFGPLTRVGNLCASWLRIGGKVILPLGVRSP